MGTTEMTKQTPRRRPSSTIRIPARLISYITGTGWYQGEPGDSPEDDAHLAHLRSVVNSGKVARTDRRALCDLAREADFLLSCSDDTYDPEVRYDRAAASRFLANMRAEGIVGRFGYLTDTSHDDPADAVAGAYSAAECECGEFHPHDFIAALRDMGFEVHPA